jgi:hypothetical protein
MKTKREEVEVDIPRAKVTLTRPVKAVLEFIKGRKIILCFSCDGAPLKLKKKWPKERIFKIKNIGLTSLA